MDLDKLFELNPEAIVWDGLNEAIIGMASKELDRPIIVTFVKDGEFDSYEVLGTDEEDEPIDRWGRMAFGPIIAYSVDKIIEILMESIEVDEDKQIEEFDSNTNKYIDALEHFDYNIDGAYVGKFTPLHIYNEVFKE